MLLVGYLCTGEFDVLVECRRSKSANEREGGDIVLRTDEFAIRQVKMRALFLVRRFCSTLHRVCETNGQRHVRLGELSLRFVSNVIDLTAGLSEKQLLYC